MKLLLTGGTGFLGKRVLKSLLSDPKIESVVVLSRKKPTHPDPRVIPFAADLTLPTSLKELKGEFDAVIHLAGLYDFNADYSENYLGNVIATQTLMEWAEGKTNRILYASTFAIHDPTLEGTLTETRMQRLPSRAISYAYTKALAEELLLSSQFDLEIFRLGALIAGPSDFVPEKLDGPYAFMRLLSYPQMTLETYFGDADSVFKRVMPIARALVSRIPVVVPASPKAHLPLVPVDVAATVITEATLRPESSGPKARIYHVLHPDSVRAENFVGAVRDRLLPGAKISYRPLLLNAVDKLPLGPFNEIKPLLKFGQFQGTLSTARFEARCGKDRIPAFESYAEAFFRGFDAAISPAQYSFLPETQS